MLSSRLWSALRKNRRSPKPGRKSEEMGKVSPSLYTVMVGTKVKAAKFQRRCLSSAELLRLLRAMLIACMGSGAHPEPAAEPQ